MQYPMYTVPVKEVLKMEEVRPHEALMEDDILVEFHSSMGKAAFVSHQWVSPWHPDPEFSQFKHLQGAMKKILTSPSVHRVHPHIMTEIGSPVGFVKGIAIEDFRSKPLFVWYDYFSCPQINDMKWSFADLAKPIDQALQSIPAYIASCTFFFVLVPPVETPSRTELLGLSTWASRGWCRMEKVLKELQPKNAGYIVISGENHCGTIEAPIMSHMIGGPAGEGTFGFREDYEKLGSVLTKFLQGLIFHYLEEEHFSAYRFFLNMQSVYLRGFPNLSPDLFHPVPAATGTEKVLESSQALAYLAGKQFLFQNGFKTVKDTDRAGWSAFCYAALRGDAAILRSLLELRANPNDKTRKNQSLFGVQAGVTVLGIATFFGHNQAVQVLIEARASLSGGLIPPLLMAAQVNNVEAIRLLCAAGDRPDRVSVLGLTAAQLAASTSSRDALRELLLQSSTLGLAGTLVAAATFAGTVEVIDQLVSLRADVNNQSYSSVLWYFQNLRYRCGARTGAAHLGYHSFGATPLMYAIVAGQHGVAATLIVAKAKLNVVNYRNKTALDLAHQFQAPSFLIDALLGDATVCNRIVSLALNKQHPVQENA
eukprot:Skav221712  [mRNA]  locus=scaffold542:91634:93418:- [translate_table: standard]